MTRERPLAETHGGTLRGVWRDGAAAFLGVPYAEAPVGPLRFGAPVPARPWKGIREAAGHGPTACRTGSPYAFMPEMAIAGDDILNLNVVTPSPDRSAGLPVLVWIHGGGFLNGASNNVYYEGQSFARDGVVVVTIGYRLGFDGFGHVHGAPHNRGVRDWLAALEWVRDNIGAFGGDPGRVTVAGESAGGGAVLTLLGMESAQPLFHAAISLSGALSDTPLERSERMGRRFARALGTTPDRAGFAAVPEQRLLSVQDGLVIGSTRRPHRLLSTAASLSTGILPIGPVVDGELVRRPTLDSLTAGIGADKPLLLAVTDDENTAELARALPAAVDRLPASRVLHLVGRLSEPERSRFIAHHPGLGTRTLLGRLAAVTLFQRLALEVADARGTAPSWLARLAWPSPTYGDALHALDLPFFFDILTAPSARHLVGDDAPQAIADELHGAAVRLAHGRTAGWEPWLPQRQSVRVLGTPVTTEHDGFPDARLLSRRLRPQLRPDTAGL